MPTLWANILYNRPSTRKEKKAEVRVSRTRVLPHVLLHKPVVRETFLADEGVTRRRGVHARLVVPEKYVSKLVVPLLARRRERLLRAACA